MRSLCSIDGCGEPVKGRGLCNKHRLRLIRYGDPLHVKRAVGPCACGKKECPGAKKINAHLHYLKDSVEYRARAARQNATPEYIEQRREYFSREDIKVRAREKTRQWRRDNPERKRDADKKFIAANRALVVSYKAQYRAARKRATPPWLTAEMKSQIRAVYIEARRLTERTGIRHDVDHIVPLSGGTVSGLHVPWNLRAIPADMNNRRPRKWAPAPFTPNQGCCEDAVR